MADTLLHTAGHFKGRFLAEPEALREKLAGIRAYVFDWDGVFNDGKKDEGGSSPFSEVDAMGTNLLRFNHYLRTGTTPVTAIITGEHSAAAYALAQREHFHGVYYGVRYKAAALQHICKEHGLAPEEVAFVFDDVLDLSAAALCGLRVMVYRECNPLLLDFAAERGLADYITSVSGGAHAVREASELLTGISGLYRETIEQRMHFADNYRGYLRQRDQQQTLFYTAEGPDTIIPKQPL
jgi:3-deoxy-D-manno-octulosonate 8-phosphate phosphatase (KDO 8-P phosphatase)